MPALGAGQLKAGTTAIAEFCVRRIIVLTSYAQHDRTQNPYATCQG